jgi:hypothetical protein
MFSLMAATSSEFIVMVRPLRCLPYRFLLPVHSINLPLSVGHVFASFRRSWPRRSMSPSPLELRKVDVATISEPPNSSSISLFAHEHVTVYLRRRARYAGHIAGGG